MTMSGSFDTVFLLMGAMTLFTFVVTDIAYFVLRYREPELERPFRARGILICRSCCWRSMAPCLRHTSGPIRWEAWRCWR